MDETKVIPDRPEDAESAQLLAQLLNSEPMKSAVSQAMREAHADLIAFGAMRPPRYYMEKALKDAGHE